jgi:hypothetical protein
MYLGTGTVPPLRGCATRDIWLTSSCTFLRRHSFCPSITKLVAALDSECVELPGSEAMVDPLTLTGTAGALVKLAYSCGTSLHTYTTSATVVDKSVQALADEVSALHGTLRTVESTLRKTYSPLGRRLGIPSRRGMLSLSLIWMNPKSRLHDDNYIRIKWLYLLYLP